MKKNSQKISLSRNALLNGLQSFLNLIFPLITFPYVSRVLSVNGMGIYNFSNTYVGYFLLIAGLGINIYAVREGSKYRDNPKKINDFVNQIFSINMLSTIFAYFLLVVSLFFFRKLNVYTLCISVFSLQIIFTTLGVNWLYIIYEDYAYITIRNIVFKIISIVLLFLFVRNKNDYIIYAGITVIAGVGSNVLNFIHARSFVNLKLTFKMKLKYHLKPILIIFASVIGVNIYLYADNTILGLIKGDYAVGIYSVSTKIYKIAEDLLSALLTVTIPRLSMLYGKKLYKEYNSLLSQLFNILLVLSLPAAIGLIALSREVVIIVAGNKYLPSSNSLAIISLAMIFSLFNWIFSDCVLLPSKRENKLLITTVITAVFNIIINLVLIPKWSYDAASFSTVISELIAMSFNAYYGKDILRESNIIQSSWKEFIKSIVGCIFIVIICKIITLLIHSIILSLSISIILSVAFYILIMALLKSSSIMQFINIINKRTHGKIF